MTRRWRPQLLQTTFAFIKSARLFACLCVCLCGRIPVTWRNVTDTKADEDTAVQTSSLSFIYLFVCWFGGQIKYIWISLLLQQYLTPSVSAHSPTTKNHRHRSRMIHLCPERWVVFLQMVALETAWWGMLKELPALVRKRDRETDGGRRGFVQQPFPTLPFTFSCMAAPGLSDMTNRSARSHWDNCRKGKWKGKEMCSFPI